MCHRVATSVAAILEQLRPIVNYSLHSADKADIPAEIHKYRFYELCNRYADYCRIYTDGSKAGERVASAIVYKGITKSVRLPDLTASFVLNYMLYFWQSMLFADQS